MAKSKAKPKPAKPTGSKPFGAKPVTGGKVPMGGKYC